MFGSSLPVWATIYLLGGILVVVLSMLNPYVPKSQKHKAEWEKRSIIYYKTHFAETFLLLIGVIISAAATVFFIIEDYSSLVESLSGGAVGYIGATLILIFGFFISQIVILIAIVVVEELTIEDMEKYYKRRYNATLLNADDLAFKTEKENPRE